jgi:hypothetical protein
VTSSDDVTFEILEAAQDIYDGWYNDVSVIDWEDFIDRLDGTSLEDGTKLDLGDDLLSPAIKSIKRHIRKYVTESI